MQMKLTDSFFLKNRLAVMKIARDMVAMPIGSKISTITEYAEKFNISRGTVQNAITYLSEKEAITIQKKGHMGTHLVHKDIDKIWSYTGWGSLTGVMSLPLNLLSSGLATGICECMKQHNINFNCIFIQGSKTRIEALADNKYDFIVASSLTASLLKDRYQTLELVSELDGCGYAGRYVLLFSDHKHSRLEEGMTISVDPSSIDQLYLTDSLCKNLNIKRLETTYINTYKNVALGKADAAVGRLDIINDTYTGMHYIDLDLSDYTQKQIEGFSKAVILAERDNYGLKALLQKVLNPAEIAEIQSKVTSQQMFPSYY